jgi:hypothetical protein
MKHWVRLTSRLYPASWRQRYAAEFDAMLDQVDPGWKDVFDILKGALTMQFTSWNLKTIVLAFGLLGVVIAAAVAFSIPNLYSSMSVMHITTGPEPVDEVIPVMSKAEKDVLSSASLERITRDIRVRLIPTGTTRHSAAFMIETSDSDPKLAQTFNRELVTKFTTALPHAGALTSLEVLDPPSWPGQPIYPRRYGFLFIGLFSGMLIGLTVSYALRWRITVVRRPAH